MVRRPANAPPLEEAALRGSPTDRRPTPRPRRVRRAALAVAPGVLLLPLLGAAPPGSGPSAPTGLQGAFTAAAERYGVPRSVLLGVSYLQSRWDAHGGAPSVTGGYGPMHLTDARTALAGAPFFLWVLRRSQAVGG